MTFRWPPPIIYIAYNVCTLYDVDQSWAAEVRQVASFPITMLRREERDYLWIEANLHRLRDVLVETAAIRALLAPAMCRFSLSDVLAGWLVESGS